MKSKALQKVLKCGKFLSSMDTKVKILGEFANFHHRRTQSQKLKSFSHRVAMVTLNEQMNNVIKDNSFKCECVTFNKMKQGKCNSKMLLFVQSAFV